jgi:hypothetical protein
MARIEGKKNFTPAILKPKAYRIKPANRSNTMSAVTCGIMLLTSTVFCAMIGDFAPTTIGAKWVYNYYEYYSHITYLWYYDSLTVSITVSSKNMQGHDTVIVLGVSEVGRKLYDNRILGIHTDTTGTWNYTDTAIAAGDSIVRVSYRCPIFPFFKYHTITQDSLKRVLLDNDSVFCFSDSSSPTYYYYYYQNIGYFSFDFEMATNQIGIAKANLISFNNNNISVAAKPIVNKPTARPAVSFRHAVIILNGKQMRNNGIYYNLSGKRISARQYHGILLGKIGNP